MTRSVIDWWKNIKEDRNKLYKELFDKEKTLISKEVSKDSIVLDIGCGDGEMINFLSHKAKKVFGVDYDKIAIKKTNKNLARLKNVKVFLEDAERLHFPSNSFDVAICFGATFGNFEEKRENILKEINRVLKKNGTFVMSIYHENSLNNRVKMYNKYGILKSFSKEGIVTLKDGTISKQFSKEEIISILKKNNFKLIKIIKGKIFYLIKTKTLK